MKSKEKFSSWEKNISSLYFPKKLLAELKDNNENLSWGNKLFIVAIVILVIIQLFSIYPIAILFIISLFKGFNTIKLVIAVLGIFFSFVIGTFRDKINLYFELTQLKKHLSYLNKFGIEINYHDISEFIEDENLIDKIKFFYPDLNKRITIGRVLVIKPQKNEKIKPITTQFKGFNIPNGFFYIAHDRKVKMHQSNMSVVIIRDTPDNLSLTGKFFLYHEMAHLTEQANFIKEKSDIHISNFLVLILLWITFSANQGVLLLLSGFIFYVFAFIYYNKGKIKLIEEYYCDGFAINLFESEEEINTLKRRLKMIFDEKRFKELERNLSLVYGRHLDRLSILVNKYHIIDLRHLIINAIFTIPLICFALTINYSFSIIGLIGLIILTFVIMLMMDYFTVRIVNSLPSQIILNEP